MKKINPSTHYYRSSIYQFLELNQFAFVSSSGGNVSYEFNLECSLKSGTSPGCSGRKRRSGEKSTEISIGYKIETKTAEIEQFGSIVTVRDTNENGVASLKSNVLFTLFLLFQL